jgi:hypothetical protein
MKAMQRFSPKRKNSPWTELNKDRVRRLERLGLMTDAGRRVLPAMGPRSFRINPDVTAALKAARAWSKIRSFEVATDDDDLEQYLIDNPDIKGIEYQGEIRTAEELDEMFYAVVSELYPPEEES